MNDYNPVSANALNIELFPDMLKLLETVAPLIHDTWAAERIKDGWRYGAERNDRLKTTPCLVPFSELPASEQKYDMATGETVIKAILAAGYNIIPRTSQLSL